MKHLLLVLLLAGLATGCAGRRDARTEQNDRQIETVVEEMDAPGYGNNR